MVRAGIEPAISGFQVRHPNHSGTLSLPEASKREHMRDEVYNMNDLNQEIIERVNPPYSSPKVIPLKLLLDIVPRFSEDVTRAMRGQPKRLSRSFVSYRNFVCFSARLAVHYTAVYSLLGSLIKETSTATSTMAV